MLALIFHPKRFGQYGSFVFNYALNRNNGSKSRREEVELAAFELKKGVSFVEPEVWAQIIAHGKNGTIVDRMTAQGALSVYTPDAEDPVGSTADFSDLNAVAAILNNTTDADWISRSISRDSRKEVFKMGSARLKEIEEDKNDRRSQTATMEFV